MTGARTLGCSVGSTTQLGLLSDQGIHDGCILDSHIRFNMYQCTPLEKENEPKKLGLD